MYGPVAGSGVRACRPGVVAGSTSAKAMVSLYRKSGSGWVRWKVTVPARSSAAMPRDRSQVAGAFWHAAVPLMAW